MDLTRDFRETVRARVRRDPLFRDALLYGADSCLLSGEVEVGETLLCDCADAIVDRELPA